MILTEIEEQTWKKAIHLLRIRDYSSYELKTKLLQKGHNISLIEPVLQLLEMKGFINDENLARMIITKSLKMIK